MDLPDFLTRTKFDEIRLTGSRIGLLHIVREYKKGASAEQVALTYPTLSICQIEQVFEFYLSNRAAVDEYVREYEAEMDRLAAVHQHISIETLRARKSRHS
jgi:uncharacterized protein (DUF433 family)